MFALYSAWYFWIPKILGLNYSILGGNIHFWILFVGVNVTFFPQHFLGLQGMPRRISDYPDAFAGWNLVSSFGSIISVIGTWVFLYVLYNQLVEGKETTRYPWLTPQFNSDSLRALLIRAYISLEWGLKSPPKPHSFTSLPLQSFVGTNKLLLPPAGGPGHSNGGPRSVIKMKTITELQDEFGKKNYTPWSTAKSIKDGHRDHWVKVCRLLQKRVNEHEVQAEKVAFWEDEGNAAEKVEYHYNKMLAEYATINDLQRERNDIPRVRTPIVEGDCTPACSNPHISTSGSANTSTGPAKKGFDAASMLDEFDPKNHVVYPAVFIYLSDLFYDFLSYFFSFLNIFTSLFVLCAIPFLCYKIYVFLYNKKK